MKVFISLSAQNALFSAQKVLFLFSFVLNAISLTCLLKRTPAHQDVIRNYLILLQIMIITFDIVFDAAVEPMPLFPIAGGYCCGWLCTVGIPPTLTMRCFYSFALAIFYGPALYYTMKTIDQATVERVIDDSDLGWVRGRGLYHFEPKGLVTTGLGLTLTASPNRSEASTKAIKRSLKILFIQVFVPASMFGGSATVIGIGIATHDLVPFGRTSHQATGMVKIIGNNTPALRKGDPEPPLAPGCARIYSMRFCPWAERAVLYAAAKGIEVEIVNINLAEKPVWHFNKHPQGKMPAFEKDGKATDYNFFNIQ
uniref:Glutathione-dependent dehydroascorbate reductase n=1 Tax=Pristionchus pacificus TaxID=54126 RepID=A0A2A6B395_PRIPA|eukprot:PDM60356.1 G protein-coupled receptor [Pristionchus pacificus]